MDIHKIHPKDFHYELPESRIASRPLDNRADSKLLFYDQGQIDHHNFSELPELLKSTDLIVMNDTRVIPARIIFHKQTGARVEIFLLEPVPPQLSMEEVMQSTGSCSWKCMIGNAKRFRIGTTLIQEFGSYHITCKRTDDQVVQLSWNTNHTFSALLEDLGRIPLPPYIKREVEAQDKDRYQTVYSRHEGAVAAPTAGLHMTPELLAQLKRTSSIEYVTLHVSAGTFQPITTDAGQHDMHEERIIISRSVLKSLMEAHHILAVGTTSLRTLESLYWYGVRLAQGHTDFTIEKTIPYLDNPTTISKEAALQRVLDHMEKNGFDELMGVTSLMIVPGYRFQVVNQLITNFHMPGTTLMMLVAAFIGEDWSNVYAAAMANDYRFLSYGDASLLIPESSWK